MIITKSENRAFASENEDESGNELSQGGSNGVRVSGLIGPSNGISSRRHNDGKNSSKREPPKLAKRLVYSLFFFVVERPENGNIKLGKLEIARLHGGLWDLKWGKMGFERKETGGNRRW